MGTSRVVVRQISPQQAVQVRLVKDQHPIQAPIPPQDRQPFRVLHWGGADNARPDNPRTALRPDHRPERSGALTAMASWPLTSPCGRRIKNQAHARPARARSVVGIPVSGWTATSVTVVRVTGGLSWLKLLSSAREVAGTEIVNQAAPAITGAHPGLPHWRWPTAAALTHARRKVTT
jgi:hypothetical protein